ncbi:hypothetical protein P3W45_000864 [Vairimorpha bombi]|jgi:E3 ubiquitin-protein ligase ZNF598
MSFECVICISKSQYIVEYECKHQVCVHCGIRLLKLYETSNCPLCKQKSNTYRIKSLRKNKIVKEISEKEIVYENEECKSMVDNLLLHKCQTCHLVLKDTYKLRSHYREIHSNLLCFECTDNKKQFWFEYVLYNVTTLRLHKKGKLNEDGFRGHVYCPFCCIYFYDENSAKHHSNQSHVHCAVCDILGNRNKYYKGFAELEMHFKNAHYCCTYNYCLGIKAYAFPYKTELLEHLLKFHKQSAKLSDIRTNRECNVEYFDPYYLNNQNHIKSKVLNEGLINLSINKLDESNSTKEIPNYLDRTKLSEIKRQQSLRKALIKRLLNTNQEEVYNIVEKIVTKRLAVKDGFEDIRLIVKDSSILKLVKEIYWADVQQEINEYYKILEKQILFPKFESKSGDTNNQPRKQEKNVGFKIVDLSNYKRK